MNFLVSGGAGMIGSHLVGRLLAEGNRVTVIDDFSRGRIDYLPSDHCRLRIIEFDLRKDISILKHDISRYKFDCAVHLADNVAGIKYVFNNQLKVWTDNLAINSNFFALVDGVVDFVIYAGTACSYPKALQTKIAEKRLVEDDAYPAEPESSYGMSKLMGEYELALYADQGRFSATTLRFHNVFGTNTEFSGEGAQVIPALCYRAATANYEDPLTVWGSGKQRRGFIYVADVIDAIMTAIAKKPSEDVIQIGPESSTSIADISALIVDISEKKLRVDFDLSKPEGDFDRLGDYSRARSALSWSPKVSLIDGLETVYRWIERKVQYD